jgi:hypothetical protein
MFGEIAKWILIAIGGAIGLVILYIVGWQALNMVAPDFVVKYNLYFVLRDIKRYFVFLLDKGYKIANTHYSFQHFGNWIVTLESQKCTIFIIQDRLELQLSLAPRKAEMKDSFSLESMIYFLTKGQEFIGYFEGNLSWGKKKQFGRLANLLRKYHDQIVPYFDNNGNNLWESDFSKHKDDLISNQKRYNELLMADYRQKHIK